MPLSLSFHEASALGPKGHPPNHLVSWSLHQAPCRYSGGHPNICGYVHHPMRLHGYRYRWELLGPYYFGEANPRNCMRCDCCACREDIFPPPTAIPLTTSSTPTVHVVHVVSATVFEIGFEGNGVPDIRYYASFDLPPPMLTYFGGNTIYPIEAVDSSPLTASAIPPSFFQPPYAAWGKGQARDLKQVFLRRQSKHLLTFEKNRVSFFPPPFSHLHYKFFPSLVFFTCPSNWG